MSLAWALSLGVLGCFFSVECEDLKWVWCFVSLSQCWVCSCPFLSCGDYFFGVPVASCLVLRQLYVRRVSIFLVSCHMVCEPAFGVRAEFAVWACESCFVGSRDYDRLSLGEACMASDVARDVCGAELAPFSGFFDFNTMVGLEVSDE